MLALDQLYTYCTYQTLYSVTNKCENCNFLRVKNVVKQNTKCDFHFDGKCYVVVCVEPCIIDSRCNNKASSFIPIATKSHPKSARISLDMFICFQVVNPSKISSMGIV